MIIGILKEIKPQENRVCMTPAGVDQMKANGHTVYVEKNAGTGSGFDDTLYMEAGARIVDTSKPAPSALPMKPLKIKKAGSRCWHL